MRRFCKTGRPLTLCAGFAFATLLCGLAHDALQKHDGPSFVVNALNFPNTQPYLCALVFPMIVAALLGRRAFAAIVRGRLSTTQIVTLGIGLSPLLIAFSGIIALGYFSFPAVEFRTAFHSAEGPPWLAFLFAPFAEELLYQVGIQTNLQRFGPIAAVIGATVPFWAMHLPGGFVSMPDAVLFLLPAILVYGIVRQVSKSFGAATLLHATYNVFGTMVTHVAK